MNKPGRNDPCPCGSGKKYKKCCMVMERVQVSSLIWKKMRRTEGELVHILLKHAVAHYGSEAAAEAWDEFTFGEDVPMDKETEPELDTVFPPWFLFNWEPEKAEPDHYPEMTVAAHYMENKSARLDSFQRRFVEETCSQHYSFFVVTGADPGKRLSLRDLLLGREVNVHERSASTTLRKGDILFTRIVTMDKNSIMVGCAPTVIPAQYHTDIIDLRERITEQVPIRDQERLREFDAELRQFYYDIRELLRNPRMPRISNSDGEPFQPTKLYYHLDCTPIEALETLATLALVSDAEELVGDARFDQHGALQSVEFPWLKKGNSMHAHWDNTSMGHICIDGDQMTINVNSQERADVIKRKVSRRLGKRAMFRNAVISSPEKMMEEAANRPPDLAQQAARQRSEELQALPEVQQHLQEMAKQHWQAWLDTPLPALKDQTPRDAAQTTSGKERLEALLVRFEQENASPQPFNPDISALRESLGL